MKSLALLLAAAGLSGCVAYPYGAPGPGRYSYDRGGYYSQGGPYVVKPQSVFIYGSGGNWTGPGYQQGRRDRDHDGIPNRFDRDRDGDGVPNRQDRRPSNPRRN